MILAAAMDISTLPDYTVGEKAATASGTRALQHRACQILQQYLLSLAKAEKRLQPRENSLNISFSHSNVIAAAALCLQQNGRVGIDIELQRNDQSIDHDRIIARCFSAKEQQIYAAAADKAGTFFKLWCQKESLIKYLNSSWSAAASDPHKYDTVAYSANLHSYTILHYDCSYQAALCCLGQDAAPKYLPLLSYNEILHKFTVINNCTSCQA